jgi:hypothetical protein
MRFWTKLSNGEFEMMDEATESKQGSSLHSKVSNALEAAGNATVTAASATVRIAEKAAETLKNEKVKTALLLGLSVAAVMAKSRIPGGAFAKKGIDLLSDVATGLNQAHTQKGSSTDASSASSSGAPSSRVEPFDFEDTPKSIEHRTDIFPVPQQPERVTLGSGIKRGDAANIAGYSFTTSIDNFGNIQLLVNVLKSLKWPYEVGGTYDITKLTPRHWHTLLDRRGPRLPIAVRRLEGFMIEIRVGGDTPTDLASVPASA